MAVARKHETGRYEKYHRPLIDKNGEDMPDAFEEREIIDWILRTSKRPFQNGSSI